MSNKQLINIAVSQKNYLALKRLGSAGDSFNDVISEKLKEQKLLESTPEVSGRLVQSPIVETKITSGGDSST
jgi:predicted CopG family antitoxin